MSTSDADPSSDEIDRAVRVAREFSGLEVAYLSEFRDGAQWIRRVDGDAAGLPIAPDLRIPLEDTYCQRVVDGRLDPVVPDAAAHEAVGSLSMTVDAGVGAYLGVPVRLPGGELYGTLCCISTRPHPELAERHSDLLRLLATAIGTALGDAALGTEAVRSQNEFLATVSHDLRTPLRAVTFIAEDLAAGDEELGTEDAAQMIIEEVDSVMGMVDDVLLVARQRSGTSVIEPETVDLVEVAERALRSSATAAGHAGERLRGELPALPLPAYVDGARVGQAIRNLLDNGLKYSPADRPVVLHLRRDDSTAVIEVEDHGIGVPADEVERLGERFFRSSTARESGIEGIGLGLASVQAIAEAHEGVLSLTSAPGEGSVFRLRLPLLRAV